MDENRIAAKFAQLRDEGRTGLILYVMTGHPSLETTERLIPALVEAGADVIELGVPFSDPLADGATVQAAGFHALNKGVTLSDCVNLVERLRPRLPDTPMLLMGYYNPILNIGVERFCRQAERASVDGLIIPDLPSEEAAPLADAAGRSGIDLIPLLAPTSTDQRIEMVCALASGFIYCVSVTGVTGARSSVSSQAPLLVEKVRRHTELPVAVGFGVSKREHFQQVGRMADAAVIGSALVRIVDESTPEEVAERASAFVSEIVGGAPVLLEGVV